MDCPLCGPNPIPGSAGHILGAYARAERQRADLLDQENRELIAKNLHLEAELKTAMDAIHSFIAPKSFQPNDLNIIPKPPELPAP